jgi:hypothetical protein
MDMNKITELLGVKTLDESVENEVKTSIQAMIDEKVESKVDEVASEKANILAKEISEKEIEVQKTAIKESLMEEYEEKFETYKDTLSKKFSLFVEDILKEKLVIPEHVIEYARKGELYDELIEQFKLRLAVDEGLITSEMKDLMSEAKDEILSLRNEKNALTEKYLEGKQLIHEASAALYINEKAKGLSESQKEKVFNILEGITDKEVIDKKFDVIVETFNSDVNMVTEEKFTVQVVDPKNAVKNLKKTGIKASAISEDEIEFDLKDKKKVATWLCSDGGWDKKELKNTYPELMEDVSSADPTPLLKEDDVPKDEVFPFASAWAKLL